MVKDYLLPIEERMMFDWLVVKQEDFGLNKPFRHSIPQVQEATGIPRYSQEKSIKHFVKLGFLKIGTETYMNNTYRSYFVDFSILSKPEVLSNIIRHDTETFEDFMKWIKELSAIQARKEKPISKYKQKQNAKEQALYNEKTEKLYKMLCETWSSRINMYNNGDLTNGKLPKRGKMYSQLPLGKIGKKLLNKLQEVYDDNTINKGFIAFADKILKGDIEPKNPFFYFLTNEDGDFKVVDDMINCYMMDYGYNIS